MYWDLFFCSGYPSTIMIYHILKDFLLPTIMIYPSSCLSTNMIVRFSLYIHNHDLSFLILFTIMIYLFSYLSTIMIYPSYLSTIIIYPSPYLSTIMIYPSSCLSINRIVHFPICINYDDLSFLLCIHLYHDLSFSLSIHNHDLSFFLSIHKHDCSFFPMYPLS